MTRPADPSAGKATDDRELARRARAGSLSSFGTLVDRHQRGLYNFLLRRTGNAADAEEFAQDAFVRAWERLHQYDDRWAFSTWLYTIASRLAANRRRRPMTLPVIEGVETAEPIKRLDDRDAGRRLWSLADRVLAEPARSALWLRYAEDRSAPEIGEILGMSTNAVRVMLHRARRRLAEAASTTPISSDSPPPVGGSAVRSPMKAAMIRGLGEAIC